MRIYNFALVMLLLLAQTSSSSAEVFERDWLVSGDGLLTFDDVNNREWLDLSETLLEQFPGAAPGASREEDLEARYQAVVTELGAGGMFEGFAVGNQDDVVSLAQSAGIDTSTGDYGLNADSVERLIRLLDVTITANNGRLISFAMLDDFDRFQRRLPMFIDFNPPRPLNLGSASVFFGYDDNLLDSTTGVMLYREIPEPMTATFVLLAFMLFLLIKRSSVHAR